MIEKKYLKHDGNIAYLLISDLPENERTQFKSWLNINGQTQPLIDGELDGNCAYPWDYDHWVEFYKVV